MPRDLSVAAAVSGEGVEADHEALIQFLYLAPIGLVQARLDGEILLINPLCSQLLMPLSRDGSLTDLFATLEGVAPDLRFLVQSFGPSHGMVCEGLQLHVTDRPPGQRQPRILSLTLLKLDEQRLMAVLGDVTQSVRRERELRQSQAWIHTIVTGLTDYALVPLDAHGRIGQWNDGVARVTGFDRAAVVGRDCALFYPPDAMSAERLQDRLHEADQSGWSLDEGWRQRADGTCYWGSCLIAPLHPSDAAAGSTEGGYSLIIRDVSDRREATETLRRSVTCDHLTGLANRRALFEAAQLELERWARAPRPLSLVLIDADHFKRVNDRHGHAAGDAVLRHLAAGMSATFRAIDVVARLGGEEFVALLPGLPLVQAEALAQQLCSSIAARPVEVDGVPIHYTISAGVAAMEPGLDSVEALIRRADAAMYAAKARGRNRVERWHERLAGTASTTNLRSS